MSSSVADIVDPTDLKEVGSFMHRIRQMVKGDEQMLKFSKEALLLVAKSVECFVTYVGIESADLAIAKKKKTIEYADLSTLVLNDDVLIFLDEILAPRKKEKVTKLFKPTTVEKEETAEVQKSNTLTNYFARPEDNDNQETTNEDNVTQTSNIIMDDSITESSSINNNDNYNDNNINFEDDNDNNNNNNSGENEDEEFENFNTTMENQPSSEQDSTLLINSDVLSDLIDCDLATVRALRDDENQNEETEIKGGYSEDGTNMEVDDLDDSNFHN